jgi:hypothetical protein
MYFNENKNVDLNSKSSTDISFIRCCISKRIFEPPTLACETAPHMIGRSSKHFFVILSFPFLPYHLNPSNALEICLYISLVMVSHFGRESNATTIHGSRRGPWPSMVIVRRFVIALTPVLQRRSVRYSGISKGRRRYPSHGQRIPG